MTARATKNDLVKLEASEPASGMGLPVDLG